MLRHAGGRAFASAAAAAAAASAAATDGVLQVCIVGSGPAGLYTAEKLIKRYGDAVRVDVLDRLPTPFGLVRSGVAPDHADTKNVVNQFTATCGDARVRFVGNVSVGADVSVGELRSLYHAVVLAHGAESDRPLGVPGEGAAGVLSAREFVWWYNGHPDAAVLPVDLSRVESVAICGIGNVALDCARVLLRRPDELAATDIAAHALAQLARTSRVRRVHLVARRGPVQAACTPRELKELVNLRGVTVHAPAAQMAVSDADVAEMKAVRMRRRMYDLITAAAARDLAAATADDGSSSSDASSRHLHFQFYRAPAEVLVGADGAAAGVRVERTQLEARPDGRVAAVGTGEFEDLEAQLVLKSIGYKSLPLAGAPFDARAGVVPNVAGRVLRQLSQQQQQQAGSSSSDSGSEFEPGLYVCGWVKRGPTGLIGTNSSDADETVNSIIADAPPGASATAASPTAGLAGLAALLASRGVPSVDFDGWRAIDAAEVAAGREVGKPREKLVRVDDMLKAAAVAAEEAGS